MADLKADWVAQGTAGKTEADWKFDHVAANLVAAAVNKLPDATQITAKGYVAGNTEYRLLATLPIDDDNNAASLSINGRMGGWQASYMALWQIILGNRSEDEGGVTVTATVLGQGAIANALFTMDLVVYAQADKSAKVYLKLPATRYYTYDFSVLGVLLATVDYDGSSSTTTPSGTLIWSLSTADKLTINSSGAPSVSSILDENGNTSIRIGATPSAVNFLGLTNADSQTVNPLISAEGANTDISVVFQPKGTGSFVLWEGTGQAAGVIKAGGTATNVGINLVTQGAGDVTVQDEDGYPGFSVNIPANPTANYVYTAPNTTGYAPNLGSWGTDTDVDLNLTTKGAGDVLVNDANIMVVAGSSATPISSNSAARPATSGPVYWICAFGVTPTNAVTGDIIFNAEA